MAILFAAAVAATIAATALADPIELPPITIPGPTNAPAESGRQSSPSKGDSIGTKPMPGDVRTMASQYVRAAKACDVAIAGGSGHSPQCNRRDDLSTRMQARGWTLGTVLTQLSDECSAKGRAAEIVGGMRSAGQSPQTAFTQVHRIQGVELAPDYMKRLVNHIYFGEGRAFGPFDLQQIASNTCYFGPNEDPDWQPLR
jgi:hypothetical protein